MSSKEAQRVAVVTGASSGIGAALTRRLLSEGWKVALVARSTLKMREVCEGFDPSSYLVCSADLSVNSQSIDAVNQIREWLKQCCDGRLDLLVNNAGAISKKDELSIEMLSDLEWILRLNVTSAFIFLSGLKPALLRSSNKYQNQPSVINMGSMAGVRSLGVYLYAITKASLHHLTRVASVDLAPNQIRVNTVAAGHIRTDIMRQRIDNEVWLNKHYEKAASNYPIGRIGNLEEIVETVLFLSDPIKSGFLTGQTLIMDGGLTLTQSGFRPKKLTIPSKI